MATQTLKISIDEDMKKRASALFESIGMDIPTAVRIFIKKSVSEGRIPFTLTDNRLDNTGLSAFTSLRNTALSNGLSDMTTGEIEHEIAAVRSARHASPK